MAPSERKRQRDALLNPPIRVWGSSFAVPSPHLFPAWAGRWAGARCGVACACVRLRRRAAQGTIGFVLLTTKALSKKNKTKNHLRSPSPISNLQRHILPDPVRSPISISNLQSPISTCGGGVSGGESTSFQGDALFLSHLQADLHPLFAPFCNLQSATRFSRRLWREVNISVSGLRSRGADGGSSRSLSSVKDL